MSMIYTSTTTDTVIALQHKKENVVKLVRTDWLQVSLLLSSDVIDILLLHWASSSSDLHTLYPRVDLSREKCHCYDLL